MYTGFSAAALKAMAGNCVVANKVEVWSASGTLLQDITASLDATTPGQVVEDETASTRRSCTLTIDNPSLIPNLDTDLLHPLSANELKVYRGVLVPGASTPEYAPLGVFGISNPKTTDTGAQIQLEVTGNDRSEKISLASWTGAFTPTAGTTVQAAIKVIINSKWTGVPLLYNMFPSTVLIPKGLTLGIQYTAFGVQPSSGSTSNANDPWADCVALALSAGCELFFDRTGTVVMRPVPEPGTGPSLATFQEGPACTVVSAQRGLDISTFYNQVIIVGTGLAVTNTDGSSSPGNPVVGTASSTDPLLGPSGPLGPRPDFIIDDTASTTAQANTAAASQLSKVMSALDATSFDAVENPALDAGDAITLIRDRMNLDNQYIVQAVTHPLDAATPMSVTNRSFAVTA